MRFSSDKQRKAMFAHMNSGANKFGKSAAYGASYVGAGVVGAVAGGIIGRKVGIPIVGGTLLGFYGGLGSAVGGMHYGYKKGKLSLTINSRQKRRDPKDFVSAPGFILGAYGGLIASIGVLSLANKNTRSRILKTSLHKFRNSISKPLGRNIIQPILQKTRPIKYKGGLPTIYGSSTKSASFVNMQRVPRSNRFGAI